MARPSKKRKKDAGDSPSSPLRDPINWLIWIALGLAVSTVGAACFTLIGAYLAPALGTGWVWWIGTAVVSLGLPAGIAAWFVRPIHGYKRVKWFAGIALGVGLLAVIAPSAIAPTHSSRVLRRHGVVAFSKIFGAPSNSSVTALADSVVHSWADLLGSVKKRKPKRRAAPRPRPKNKAAPRPVLRTLEYQGQVRVIGRVQSGSGTRAATGPAMTSRYLLRGGGTQAQTRIRRKFRQSTTRLMLDPKSRWTTISRFTARSLRIVVPAKAVRVEVMSTSTSRYPLVVLDEMSLGRARLRRVTVAICDPCTPPRVAGRLGLNFLRHFALKRDRRRRVLSLRRRRGSRRNRIDDIEPFLTLQAIKGAILGTKATIEGVLRSRAPATARGVKLRVFLLDARRRRLSALVGQATRIRRGQKQRFRIAGDVQAKTRRFQIAITHARW